MYTAENDVTWGQATGHTWATVEDGPRGGYLSARPWEEHSRGLSRSLCWLTDSQDMARWQGLRETDSGALGKRCPVHSKHATALRVW